MLQELGGLHGCLPRILYAKGLRTVRVVVPFHNDSLVKSVHAHSYSKLRHYM